MNQQRTVRFFIPCLLILALLFGGCSSFRSVEQGRDQTADCIVHGWPQDTSDLQPDPSLIFGTLENGLRYVIKENHEPRNRVAVALDVQAGSLYETESQLGLAHYLEHMVFNGTTHYPPGTLVEYFQSIGMGFGADTNAHTSYDETVFKLLLPDGKEKTVDSGLLVMADYARGALLLEREVDKERGIILAEKRSRDSARSRAFKARMRFAFAGTRLAERDVIGTEDVLKHADSGLLRQYYDTWYRPGNMILVVVGDVKPGMVRQIIRNRFGGLKATDLPVTCPDFGKVSENGTAALYLYEPDLGATSVGIESVWNITPHSDSLAEQHRKLTEYVAATIFNNRLQHLVNRDSSPLIQANFFTGSLVRRVGYASLEAQATDRNWQPALYLLATSLRQALRYGFTEDEFVRAKKEVMTMLKNQAQMAESRNSQGLAGEIVTVLNNNHVVLSPAQDLALFGSVLEKMTLVDAVEAFRGLWHERRLVEVMGTADLHDGASLPETVILQAYEGAEYAEISPWLSNDDAVFPYLKFSEQGAAVERHQAYTAIGVDRYLLTNGVILNLKQTDFHAGEINVVVALGRGKLSEPVAGLSLLAESIVNESGLGGLTREQLSAALASFNSRVRFQVGEESFIFRGSGVKDETELLFQLLATHIKDPAFRTGAYQRSMEKLTQMYGQLQGSVEGMMQLRGERFLAGGDPHYGLVPLAALRKMTLGQVRTWLEPVLSNAALEISVVGDFDRNTVLRLAGRYFGTRRDLNLPVSPEHKITFPSGKELRVEVPSESDKALVTVAWPTDDFWDISRTRRLSILASVLGDRLRKQIREELGATYSPYVYNFSSRVAPGYGVMLSRMIVAPEQAGLLTEKLKEVGTGLAREGVSDEELERALEPALTSIRDLVRTNRYWLDSVLVLSSRYPQQLEWPLSIQKDFASITAHDISTLAARYLQPDKAAEIVLWTTKKQ